MNREVGRIWEEVRPGKAKQNILYKNHFSIKIIKNMLTKKLFSVI